MVSRPCLSIEAEGSTEQISFLHLETTVFACLYAICIRAYTVVATMCGSVAIILSGKNELLLSFYVPE